MAHTIAISQPRSRASNSPRATDQKRICCLIRYIGGTWIACADHYYIHALEASPHPERALPSARRLETLVPAAGHLVHMPSHIYIRTGNYDAAATLTMFTYWAGGQ